MLAAWPLVGAGRHGPLCVWVESEGREVMYEEESCVRVSRQGSRPNRVWVGGRVATEIIVRAGLYAPFISMDSDSIDQLDRWS